MIISDLLTEIPVTGNVKAWKGNLLYKLGAISNIFSNILTQYFIDIMSKSQTQMFFTKFWSLNCLTMIFCYLRNIMPRLNFQNCWHNPCCCWLPLWLHTVSFTGEQTRSRKLACYFNKVCLHIYKSSLIGLINEIRISLLTGSLIYKPCNKNENLFNSCSTSEKSYVFIFSKTNNIEYYPEG